MTHQANCTSSRQPPRWRFVDASRLKKRKTKKKKRPRQMRGPRQEAEKDWWPEDDRHAACMFESVPIFCVHVALQVNPLYFFIPEILGSQHPKQHRNGPQSGAYLARLSFCVTWRDSHRTHWDCYECLPQCLLCVAFAWSISERRVS